MRKRNNNNNNASIVSELNKGKIKIEAISTSIKAQNNLSEVLGSNTKETVETVDTTQSDKPEGVVVKEEVGKIEVIPQNPVKNDEVINKVDKVESETNKVEVENKVEDKVEDKVEVENKVEVESEVEVENKVEDEVENKVEVETHSEQKDISDEAKDVKDNMQKFKRTTRLEKTRSDKTIKFLSKNAERMKFDLAIQRNKVWNIEQKSKLIHSILYGYPIPPMLVMDTDDKNFWFLDGKQRGTTILDFMNGVFALSKNTKNVCGVEVAGLKFEDLPEDMQDEFLDETITFIIVKGLTIEERDEMFVRYNSGSVLSKIELTRAKHSDMIEQINGLSKLEFFSENIAMTETGRNRFQDQELIMQIAYLMDKGRDGIKGFGSKDIDNYVLEMKEENKLLPKTLLAEIKKVSTYMSMTASNFTEVQRKKVLKKANTPIAFHQAIQALSENVKPSIYAEFLIDFLDTNYSTESDYGQTLQSSVSKRDSVVIRISEMNIAYKDFIKKIKSERKDSEIFKNK